MVSASGEWIANIKFNRVYAFAHSKEAGSMISNPRKRGFSLVEVLIVVAIIFILVTMAIIQIAPIVRDARNNAASTVVLEQMRRTRQQAVDNRRTYRVTFVAPRTMNVDLTTITVGAPPTFSYTPVSTVDLPTDIQFGIVAGVPTTPATVPDGFGSGATAIDLNNASGGNQVWFAPDGRALNGPQGAVNSGVIYVSRPGDFNSNRAITLFGTTGRVKRWRINGSAGTSRWTE